MANPKKIDDERIEVTVIKHKDEILSQLQRQLKLEKDVERELNKIQNRILELREEADELELAYYDDTGEEVIEETNDGISQVTKQIEENDDGRKL